MNDLYKILANVACDSIDSEWERITIDIKSNLWKLFISNAKYYNSNGDQKTFELLDDNLDIDLGKCVFDLQNEMYTNHKWNKALFLLEKNGHFDMKFEWDQKLQDEWDNA